MTAAGVRRFNLAGAAITRVTVIVAVIWAWNASLWPFLAVTRTEMMTITVGITQVSDAFGVSCARQLASAVLAGFPVALAYPRFQRPFGSGKSKLLRMIAGPLGLRLITSI